MSDSDAWKHAVVEHARKDVINAVRGLSLPRHKKDLRRSHMVQAIVHGIRHHDYFANSREVIALCEDRPRWYKVPYVRARYARLIMSNIVPIMDSSREDILPYCIWYPDVASEDTYRRLAQQYPLMRYQVGRACVVAGYLALYRELDIFPDVSIAEEAQASPNGQEIFDDIMSRPCRYAIMNDYERTIDFHNESPQPGALLNGDTCILPYLQSRQPALVADPYAESTQYFDICEDAGIGEVWMDEDYYTGTISAQQADLFHQPLPTNLPTINKDMLILMAAYEGNMDRYHRLRRPKPIAREVESVIHGIYHSTSFARWWSDNLQSSRCAALVEPCRPGAMEQAINARRTMVNDLSWLVPSLPMCTLPYLFWHPLKPQRATLREILRREPRMKVQVVHACIVLDYKELFCNIDIRPTNLLLREAERSPNKFYLEYLQHKAQTQGISKGDSPTADSRRVFEPEGQTSLELNGQISERNTRSSHDNTISYYEGEYIDVAEVELFIASSLEMRERAAAAEDGLLGLYHENLD